jgi:hypothetical protein
MWNVPAQHSSGKIDVPRQDDIDMAEFSVNFLRLPRSIMLHCHSLHHADDCSAIIRAHA